MSRIWCLRSDPCTDAGQYKGGLSPHSQFVLVQKWVRRYSDLNTPHHMNCLTVFSKVFTLPKDQNAIF